MILKGILPQNHMLFHVNDQSSELGKETITVEQIGPICRRKGCPTARSPPPPISPSKEGVKNNNEEVKEAINPDGLSGFNRHGR